MDNEDSVAADFMKELDSGDIPETWTLECLECFIELRLLLEITCPQSSMFCYVFAKCFQEIPELSTSGWKKKQHLQQINLLVM